jgi:arylsulfate sulfotransferase
MNIMKTRLRSTLLFYLTIEMLTLATRSHALTISSGPFFTPAPNAPLAGVLRLTTDVDSRVSVSVNDGTKVWQRRFYDYGIFHSIPLLGFKPGRTNFITVTVYDRNRNAFTATQPLEFDTAALPLNFPTLTIRQSNPALMEPGYTLFRVGMHNEAFWYVTIVDSAGEVVWYGTPPSTADIRQLEDGNLFMPCTNRFAEVNLLGEEVNSWVAPTNLPINLHDGVPTPHGTILYLSTAVMVVSNYPTSATNADAPLTTTNVLYEKVVELSAADASLLNVWSPVDVLDPRRISYLFDYFDGGWDSEHSNAIIEDPRDDSLIVSMRHQNAVVKFSRDTGQLIWILGPPENWGPAWQPYLFTPVGTPFEWQYAQHSPIISPHGTLMLFDDGNFRASPFLPPVPDTNNYTRAVEYSINEQTMEVSQVWDYGRTNVAERLYVDHEGIAEPEPITGNVLIDFSAVSYIDGVPPSSYGPRAYEVRIQEVTHDAVPQIVFDLQANLYDNPNTAYKDTSSYRSHRIRDLYAHPPLSVADLSVSHTNGTSSLEFSADDARSYRIEASTNLVDWESIGLASEIGPQSGNYAFQDTPSTGLPARYYRVVTQ